MNTYLGAAQDLQSRRHRRDGDCRLPPSPISKAICGTRRTPRRPSVKAATIAHKAGRKVALTLSDAFCVDRYRAEFLDLIRSGTVDIVFANERELHSLYQTADFDTAANALRGEAKLAVVTRSEKGCVVVSGDEHRSRCRPSRSSRWSTRPAPAICSRPASWSAWRAARITAAPRGSARLAAAEVIQHLGARPEVSLKALAEENGLLVETGPGA